MNILWK